MTVKNTAQVKRRKGEKAKRQQRQQNSSRLTNFLSTGAYLEAACSCIFSCHSRGIFGLIMFFRFSLKPFLSYSGFSFGFRFQLFLSYIRGFGWLGFSFSKRGGGFLSLVFIPTFVKPICCCFRGRLFYVWSSVFFFCFKSTISWL